MRQQRKRGLLGPIVWSLLSYSEIVKRDPDLRRDYDTTLTKSSVLLIDLSNTPYLLDHRSRERDVYRGNVVNKYL